MTARSTTDETFLRAVQDLLGGGEILVVVRYVYGAGAREFLFFKDMTLFRAMLNRLRRRDSVVVMKSFRKVIEGAVDGPFVDAAAARYAEGKDWVLLDADAPKFARSYCVESGAELMAELREMQGRRVCIIEEPDVASEEHSIGAYVPDPDGVVRPGVY